VQSMDITMMKNTWSVIFAMNTITQSIFMKDSTTADFQSVVIMHATNAMTLCLVHLG
jgi:hypothetical protein